MRVKYHDNMTKAESDQLLAEIERLEEAYARVGDCSTVIHDEESLDHFNRFVAGDRK